MIRSMKTLPLVVIVVAVSLLPTALTASGTGPRTAVIPISDNAPPSLRAAHIAASHVEALPNRQGRLDVVDSGSVATAVRAVKERSGAADVDWRDVAEELDIELAALLSVIDAHVDYLVAIFDDSVKTGTAETLTDDYAPLAMVAVERASKKLDDPLREAFPLRGVIILVEGRKLTVDIGSTSESRRD